MPSFDDKPPLDDPKYWNQVDRSFSRLTTNAAAERAKANQGKGDAGQAGTTQASTPLPSAKSLFAGSGLAAQVIDTPEGEHLGTVREIVIDPNANRVSYVVLGVADEKNSGGRERFIAVPWSSLRSTPDKDDPNRMRWTMSTTREKLLTGPEFQQTDEGWKTASDRAFATKVYEYYSVAPYWQSDNRDARKPQ